MSNRKVFNAKGAEGHVCSELVLVDGNRALIEVSLREDDTELTMCIKFARLPSTKERELANHAACMVADNFWLVIAEQKRRELQEIPPTPDAPR